MRPTVKERQSNSYEARSLEIVKERKLNCETERRRSLLSFIVFVYKRGKAEASLIGVSSSSQSQKTKTECLQFKNSSTLVPSSSSINHGINKRNLEGRKAKLRQRGAVRPCSIWFRKEQRRVNYRVNERVNH